uniref:Uncharacterized protein LOC113792428 n=1 Tax=Dermatophagoides pteronyssinus TaxID=6956 RepID=A0A6P6XZ11_DERPT|nr:uncharacterized protein LOC113792428 [Dermatophagoides pteronyssinus]
MIQPLIICMMMFAYSINIDNIECLQFEQVPKKCDKKALNNCLEIMLKKYPSLPSRQSSKPSIEFCCFYLGNFYCRLEIAKKCNRKWAKELEQNNYIKHMCKVYSQKELNEKCLFGRQENHKLRDRSFELIRPGLSKKINNTENMEEYVDVDIPNLEIEGFSKTTLIAMSSALTFTSAITAIMSAIFLETGPTKTYLLVGSTMSTAIGGTWLTKEVLRLEN